MVELVRTHAPRVAHVGGLLLVTLAALVLWGWARGSAALTGVLPGLPAMMPNTAVGMMLLGCSLLAWEQTGHVQRLAAGAAAVLGLATLAEYLAGIDLGIDLLLFASRTATAPIHGRMALATAASFALGGIGMLLLHHGGRRAVVAGQSCALAVAVLASASLFGYLFGAQAPAKLAAFSSMALHTTFGFLVAAAAMLWLRPSEGLMRDLTGPGLGSMLLRWLLPGALLLPPLIGFFRLMGQHAGWYGTEFALALHVTVQGVVLAAGLWVVSRWLTRADDARRRAERDNLRLIDELREATATLEGRVALRTREVSESEAKFRSLLDLLTDWYWEQDENLRFSYVSAGYERQTGLKASDSLGKTRFELQNVFESDEQRGRHEADVAARRPYRDLRLRRRTSEGELRFVSVSGVPVFDPEGRFRGYRGVGRDITAEETAERNTQLLASIVEHTHDAVITRTLDGTILSWNKGAERMYGYRDRGSAGEERGSAALRG